MSFLDINELQLDKEWVRQAPLFSNYATKLADAQKAHDTAKLELDIVEAELDRSIRSNPDDYNLEKITENIVSAAIVLEDEYQIASNNLINAKHAVDVLKVAVNGLEHKKRALESLVKLHGQEYFASPHAREKDSEVIETMTKTSVRSGGKKKKKSKK